MALGQPLVSASVRAVQNIQRSWETGCMLIIISLLRLAYWNLLLSPMMINVSAKCQLREKSKLRLTTSMKSIAHT